MPRGFMSSVLILLSIGIGTLVFACLVVTLNRWPLFPFLMDDLEW